MNKARPSGSERRGIYTKALLMMMVVVAAVMAFWPNAGISTPAAALAAPAQNPELSLDLPLRILETHRRGQVLEIRGETATGASVLVNGESVPFIQADGRFTYFIMVPADGQTRITVTAQDHLGAARTIKLLLSDL